MVMLEGGGIVEGLLALIEQLSSIGVKFMALDLFLVRVASLHVAADLFGLDPNTDKRSKIFLV